MPYAIREMVTGLLLACPQVNGYRLPYFGVVLWDATPEDAEIREALSRAGMTDAAVLWQPVELTEHQAKMVNVKLRNDRRRRVFLRDGNLVADTLEHSE